MPDPSRARPIEIGAVSSATRRSAVTGAAVLEWTARLEQRTLTAATLEVPPAEWQRAADGVAPAVQRALDA